PADLARTARQALRLGARGVDINFGCPSRFVHHSGAMLLREPGLIHEIMLAVAAEVGGECTLSAKARAGFSDKSELAGILQALDVPGVDEIIIHCRTRGDLYRSEALDWSILAPFAGATQARLVANGDIMTRADALACAAASGCGALMVGRGALAAPNLPGVIKMGEAPMGFAKLATVALGLDAALGARGVPPASRLDRLKQFLGYARRGNAGAREFFPRFCRLTDHGEAQALLNKATEGDL
ncbi:MAG: tRNA-dihydrouridine synthase family protein, partial [Succinivibrionaceae bacterium]|nr:tRNA-dihydrouridine synthase family protein [Succinivibrionaceae bacterium]